MKKCFERTVNTVATAATYRSTPTGFSTASKNDKFFCVTRLHHIPPHAPLTHHLQQQYKSYSTKNNDHDREGGRRHSINVFKKKLNEIRTLQETSYTKEILPMYQSETHKNEAVFQKLLASVNSFIPPTQQQHYHKKQKNIHLISNLYAETLRLLSLLPKSNFITKVIIHDKKNIYETPYSTAIQILNTLDSLQLDVTPTQLHFVIQIALTEERYEEAAELFKETCGYFGDNNEDSSLSDNIAYVPMDITLGKDQPLELGLFAIAKSAQISFDRDNKKSFTATSTAAVARGRKVTDTVLQAANEMTMISPRDHDTYYLAAASAICRAGEWRTCIDYFLNNTEKGKALGQPLVETIMQALLDTDVENQPNLIVNNSHEYYKRAQTALELYERGGHTEEQENLLLLNEWHTAGSFYNSHIISPKMRECALRAYPILARFSTVSTVDNVQPSAGTKFDEDYTIKKHSEKAYQMLLDAIKVETKLSSKSLESVFETCLYTQDWQIAMKVLQLLMVDSHQKNNHHSQGRDEEVDGFFLVPPVNAKMLGLFLQTCNNANQPGIGLIWSYLSICNPREAKEDIVETLYQFNNSTETTNTSNGDILQKKITDTVDSLSSDFISVLNSNMQDDLLHFLSPSFSSEYVNSNMESIDEKVLSFMKACIAYKQPLLGLMINQRIAHTLNSQQQKQSGIQMIQPSLREKEETSQKYDDLLMIHTDELLSTVLEIYNQDQDYEKAIELFFTESENKSEFESLEDFIFECPKTTVMCIYSLLEGYAEDEANLEYLDTAFDLFRVLNESYKTHDMFLHLAKTLSIHESYDRILELWEMANSTTQIIDNQKKDKNNYDDNNTVISEELGILTLKSISKVTQFSSNHNQGTAVENDINSKINKDRFSLMGDVVWKMANLVGCSKENWKKQNYFRLKRELSGNDLYKLMHWRKGTIKENELGLASEIVINHSKEGKEHEIPLEVYMALVKQAGYKQRHVRCWGDPVPDWKKGSENERRQQHIEREEGVKLILQTLDLVRKLSETKTKNNNNVVNVAEDPSFAVLVAQGLRALKANQRCIEFVLHLIENKSNDASKEIRPMTYLQAVLAAKSIGDDIMKDHIVKHMEDAGFRYEEKAKN